MRKILPVLLAMLLCSMQLKAAAPPIVIISQYYEGGATNKWIELTNLSSSPVNTSSLQLKLALYSLPGDSGNINISNEPSQIVNLNMTIPAHGTVLIGNSGNAMEVPYLKAAAADAAQLSNAVINFNGNDGIALLDADNHVIDAFGQGINAKDLSFVRNATVTNGNAMYTAAEWTNVPIQVVQQATSDQNDRLGVHFQASLGPGAPLSDSLNAAISDTSKLNFYYGNLHSHSSYSDGNKDDPSKKPEDDYAFAKNALHMDFLGIAEHNHTQAGMSLANWQPGIEAAKNATTATFVALHGMEWGVISGGGHVIVYGIDSLIGWEPGQYQIFVPKNTYTGAAGLFNIINRHGQHAIATLAHPKTNDYNGISATYDQAADSAISGAALASGPAFSTNVNYADPAKSMSFLGYYNRMLAAGYHLGASIDHDNHNLTFGRHTRARMVVMAPALTEKDLLYAIKRMRFYASEDPGAKVTFTVQHLPVGSVFKGAEAPVISFSTSTTSPVTSIRLMYGTPGSGAVARSIASSTTGTLIFTHDALADLATGYYYGDIKEADGSRIITSPIWYTRDKSLVK